MKCINHPDVDTDIKCDLCGKPICSSCNTKIKGKNTCPECVEKELTSINVGDSMY
ncbi:MAG: hypothetical protein SVY15_00200 [Halobacteriota archaeon]|nr:hypothetical protein [Halobacteriota archaeon]